MLIIRATQIAFFRFTRTVHTATWTTLYAFATLGFGPIGPTPSRGRVTRKFFGPTPITGTVIGLGFSPTSRGVVKRAGFVPIPRGKVTAFFDLTRVIRAFFGPPTVTVTRGTFFGPPIRGTVKRVGFSPTSRVTVTRTFGDEHAFWFEVVGGEGRT